MDYLRNEVSYDVKLINGMVDCINDGEVIGFCKGVEKYGVFSNMVEKYLGNDKVRLNYLKVKVEGGELIDVRVSEGLFVCLKFNESDIQNDLRNFWGQRVKMRSKSYVDNLMEEFKVENYDERIIDLMRYSLRVKLFYNEEIFGKLLRESDGKDIVEVSGYAYGKKTGWIWGVSKDENGVFRGMNWLGKLLVELREEYKELGWKYNKVNKIEREFCGKKILDLEK